jgi:hypothetical protein
MQRDTEHRLKRACPHSECDVEPTAEQQQWERRMPPPSNPLETMGNIDDAWRCQHRPGAERQTEENRSLLQMIREQVVSDVDADTASIGLELEAECWQRKEAAAARRYTRALEVRAHLVPPVNPAALSSECGLGRLELGLQPSYVVLEVLVIVQGPLRRVPLEVAH